MSRLGQTVLMQHLTDADALDVIAREGLLIDVIPAEELRPVFTFALDYYHRSGRTKAPSVAAILSEEAFKNALEDNEIEIDAEPEDSIEWAIDSLKATYVHNKTARFNKDLATSMSEAEMGDKVQVVNEAATELVRLSMAMERHDVVSDIREGVAERLDAFEARALIREQFFGLRFGLGIVDEYTHGIHDGELCVLGAGPKTGKSYFLAWSALAEWQAGRCACLYTLENSVQLTLDRIACLACTVDSRAWQRGTATPEEVDRVRGWMADLERSDTPLIILQPEPGKRSPMHLVRDAQLRGADSILVDQLTFVEHDERIRERHLQIRQMMHDFKTLITAGRKQIPCLAAHQLSREGIKRADKTGFLEMYDFAEGSEIERTVDWGFGLYRSRDQVSAGQALLQALAARREELQHFNLLWNVGSAVIRATHIVTLETNE